MAFRWSNKATRWPKNGPNIALRWSKIGSKMAQDGPRWFETNPTRPQALLEQYMKTCRVHVSSPALSSHTSQTLSPRGLAPPLGRGKGEGSPPRSPGNGPKIAPRRSNIDSKMAQNGPTWLENSLKMASSTLITIHEATL